MIIIVVVIIIIIISIIMNHDQHPHHHHNHDHPPHQHHHGWHGHQHPCPHHYTSWTWTLSAWKPTTLPGSSTSSWTWIMTITSIMMDVFVEELLCISFFCGACFIVLVSLRMRVRALASVFVCVKHLNRCKTSILLFLSTHVSFSKLLAGGGSIQSLPPTKTLWFPWWYMAWSAMRTCIFPVFHLWPAKPRTSMSIILNEFFFCTRWLCWFACRIRSTSPIRNAILSKCVTHVGSTRRWHEPFGEYLSR